MVIKLRHIANTSIFALASIGSAIAGMELLLPEKSAFAQESIRECVQELIDQRNISERNAAIVCSNQRDDDNYDDYDDDDYYGRGRDENNGRRVRGRDGNNGRRVRGRRGGRYIELRARSGPTPEGRWRYTASGIPYEAMSRAGCQQISGDDWRCTTRRIRVQIWDNGDNRDDREVYGRYIELRARSGPTPEGRWRYTASGIPYEAMSRAGCQQISGDDWRCTTRRIRVRINDRY
ncbi:hypothetical protein [Nostoc sp. TCL26-01]|uniref:hypothetical protein n=1 Tax=Nostoc sp. TCL26-01 TaxID=2576904 RepID=UPI0015BCC893|nr:hypothetical protein [Nostoc sp. TCL26-01]QLE55791.1 hypothetical protein FD725_09825 [Nostoc sp. TCL26-01]